MGSQARGNFKQGSDIDPAIMNQSVAESMAAALKKDFAESSLPNFIDVVKYHTLEHSALKDHIDRVGTPFYRRGHQP